jgi:hypothetical protein
MESFNTPVSICSIDIPFWDIVKLILKWSIAAIPAYCVLAAMLFCLLSFVACLQVMLK